MAASLMPSSKRLAAGRPLLPGERTLLLLCHRYGFTRTQRFPYLIDHHSSSYTCSSVATEWVKGRTIADCLTIKNTDIAGHLKLPPVKLHCSMLAEDAIKAAIKDYASKNPAVVATAAAAVAAAAQ